MDFSTQLNTDPIAAAFHPPHAADLGGPEQLADVMVDFRHWHATKGLLVNGEISDGRLRQLIRLAYFSSQTPDEGRYSQLRLFCPAAGTQPTLSDQVLLRFDPPRDLHSVEALRRLAPSVAAYDRSLLIQERPAGLYATGIVSVVRPAFMGPPHCGAWARPEGLMIRVDGPGALRVTEAELTFVLHGGTVRNLHPFHLVDPVRHWFTEMSQHFSERLAEQDSPPFSPLQLRQFLIALWSEVLLTTWNLRHGGAFVILPEPSRAPVLTKTSILGCDLSEDVLQYWPARLRAEQAGGSGLSVLSQCQRMWERLQNRVRALAQLSAVDGCVVLDRNLHVESFGGLIRVEAEAFSANQPPTIDYWTGSPRKQPEMWGMRHHSAKHLCHVRPGAMAFVLSQDGELSCYCSDAQGVVTQAGPLSPAEGIDW